MSASCCHQEDTDKIKNLLDYYRNNDRRFFPNRNLRMVVVEHRSILSGTFMSLNHDFMVMKDRIDL